MKKSFIICVIIALLSPTCLLAQNLKPEQMTDRHVLGLKGDVKSVSYSDGTYYAFDQKGYIVKWSDAGSDKYTMRYYVNDKKYGTHDTFRTIEFTPQKRIDWESRELNIFTDYTFNKEGRIIESNEVSYSPQGASYKYKKGEDLIHQKIKGEGWEEGSSSETTTYTYQKKDDKGNWLKRSVKVHFIEIASDWETGKDTEVANRTSEHNETATIKYFTTEELAMDPVYFSEDEIKNQPSTAEIAKTSVPLKDRIPVWGWIIFALIGVCIAYLMTIGYKRLYEWFEDSNFGCCMPQSPIMNYITIATGLGIFVPYLLLDVLTDTQFYIAMAIFTIAVLIGAAILFFKYKNQDSRLARGKAIYFIVASFVGLLISVVVAMVAIWALFFFVVYFILFKIVLRSIFNDVANRKPMTKQEIMNKENYSEGVSIGGGTCATCFNCNGHYCSRLATQIAPSGSCNNYTKR